MFARNCDFDVLAASAASRACSSSCVRSSISALLRWISTFWASISFAFRTTRCAWPND